MYNNLNYNSDPNIVNFYNAICKNTLPPSNQQFTPNPNLQPQTNTPQLQQSQQSQYPQHSQHPQHQLQQQMQQQQVQQQLHQQQLLQHQQQVQQLYIPQPVMTQISLTPASIDYNDREKSIPTCTNKPNVYCNSTLRFDSKYPSDVKYQQDCCDSYNKYLLENPKSTNQTYKININKNITNSPPTRDPNLNYNYILNDAPFCSNIDTNNCIYDIFKSDCPETCAQYN